jgi:hypothetical protein
MPGNEGSAELDCVALNHDVEIRRRAAEYEVAGHAPNHEGRQAEDSGFFGNQPQQLHVPKR